MAVSGVLLDIDGVVTVSWQPLPGSAEAVAAPRRHGLPLRFLTNTTSRTSRSISQALANAGIEAAADILTAPTATASFLRERYPGARCYLLSSGSVAADLEGVALVGENQLADVIVIGGAGPEFTYARLNHAFHLLLMGAALVSMHRSSINHRRFFPCGTSGARCSRCACTHGRR